MKGDWLADRVLRGLIGTAMALPYERRVALMGRMLSRAIGPLAGYRKRAEAHLHSIYPDLPKATARTIATAVCDNFGRTLIENYSHAELHDRLRSSFVTGGGLIHLQRAAATNRPVIFVTGHYGNHEVPRHVLTHMGYRVGGLYRPMTNPYFNAHYAKTMTSWGGPVFAQGRKGTIGFARHIAGGGMGTLLYDVHNAAGLSLPFMGKPAMTATSAADLALKFNACVIPYFATRRPDGLTFDVTLEQPINHDTPTTMMTEMNHRLEAHVIARPDQWFWVHRRWKAPDASAQLGSA